MLESSTLSRDLSPSRTKVTCLARCLYLAAHEPMSRPSIMYLLLDKIIDLTANSEEGSEDSSDSNSIAYDDSEPSVAITYPVFAS